MSNELLLIILFVVGLASVPVFHIIIKWFEDIK